MAELFAAEAFDGAALGARDGEGGVVEEEGQPHPSLLLKERGTRPAVRLPPHHRTQGWHRALPRRFASLRRIFGLGGFWGFALGGFGSAGGDLFSLFLMDGGGDFGEVGGRGGVALLGGIVDGGADFGDDLVGNFCAATTEGGGKGGKIVCHNCIVLNNYGTKLAEKLAHRFKIWSARPNFRVFCCSDDFDDFFTMPSG